MAMYSKRVCRLFVLAAEEQKLRLPLPIPKHHWRKFNSINRQISLLHHFFTSKVQGWQKDETQISDLRFGHSSRSRGANSVHSRRRDSEFKTGVESENKKKRRCQ
jgi:hypothetical protein